MRQFDDFKIGVEKDTTIKKRELVKVRDKQAIYEEWVWDGIYGKSLIFFMEDVKGLTEDQLKELLVESFSSDTEITIKESGEYLFLNFGFVFH